MRKKFLISLGIGTILSALTLVLAFRNVPFSQLRDYLVTIDYRWLAPALILVIATFVLRTFRWRLILGDKAPPQFNQTFHPLMIGFMMNCVLPGRVGELARPILLKHRHNVPITTGLATVAAERTFDIVILISLFALLFSTVAEPPVFEGRYFGLHLNSQVLQSTARAMMRMSLILLAAIIVSSLESCRRLLKGVILRVQKRVTARWPRIKGGVDALFGLFLGVMDNVAVGFSLVRSPVRFFSSAGLTLLIWGLTAFSYFVFAKACPGINLSFIEMATVMVVICFVIALPSVPGFWGVWEAGGIVALSIFGVTGKDALGFTLVNHTLQIFPVVVIGLVSALISGVNILNLSGEPRMQGAAVTPAPLKEHDP